MSAQEFVQRRETFDRIRQEIEGLVAAQAGDQAAEKLDGARLALGALTELMTDSDIQRRVVNNREVTLARLEQDVARAQRQAKKHRRPKKAAPTWTQEQALAFFLEQYPQGFADPAYIAAERQYKVDAGQQFAEAFSSKAGAKLIAADDVAEVTRRFHEIFGGGRSACPYALLSPYEKAALIEALKDGEAAARFHQALLALVEDAMLEAESFRGWIEAVKSLPATGKRVATWPVLTFAPFIACPEVHILLKPDATKIVAARLGCDLRYNATLNYDTYSRLLEMARKLRDRLEAHGAKDFIDVQAFIGITGSHREAV